MAALSIGSVSNILLDYIFMYPMDMGIAGAALATAIGPVISVMILLPHFLSRKGALYLQRCHLEAGTIGRYLILGFPSFVMEFSIGMVTFLMNVGMNRYGFGDEGLAAYLIIGYLMLIILTLFIGMAEGLQPAFSYLFSAGEREKLSNLLHIALAVFLLIGIITYAMLFRGSILFYRLFTPRDPSLAHFAATESRFYFFGFFAAGLNILMISYYQSIQAPARALLLSSSRGFILPALLISVLPGLLGPTYLWSCHSIAEILTLSIAMLLAAAMKKDTQL